VRVGEVAEAARRWPRVRAAFWTRSSSSMISRIRSNRTMSTMLPPQVELIRLGTRNTFSSSSSIRGPARMPHTCVFFPNARMSGVTPSPW
jgi:hypothetical protein